MRHMRDFWNLIVATVGGDAISFGIGFFIHAVTSGRWPALYAKTITYSVYMSTPARSFMRRRYVPAMEEGKRQRGDICV